MDFSYDGKTITTSGGIKPSTKNTPGDVRTRVKTFAEIQIIPNPWVGMVVTVEADETNNGEMTDYKVKSLKADSYGVADSVIDEVVKYVDYLGVTGSGGAGINGEDGATFTPSVASDGTLSWTNDKSLPNPTPVNIKGAKGDKGDTGATGANGQDGVTPTLKIGTTTTLVAGSSATVSMTKAVDSEEYTINFGIPKGADGTGGSGSTADLTDYQKKTDSTLVTTDKTVVGAINEVKNKLDNKVDKINGKGLSTNDYTTEEKATLSNLKTAVGDTNSGLIKDVKDLKTNGVSQDNINSAIENYLTEHPVASGATTEQAAQIEANRTAIGDSNSGLTKEINDINNALTRVDAKTLNGKKFSNPMTKEEYEAISNKEVDTIYLVKDDNIPTYTGVQSDWNETNTESPAYIKNKPTLSNKDIILTSPNGTEYKIIVSDSGAISSEIIQKYGEIILSADNISVNEGEETTFTVTLDKAPTAEQNIHIVVSNNNCSINPSSLSFNSSNYSAEQTVRVTGITDSSDYNNKADTITLSSDNATTKTISVTIVNSDIPELQSISAVYSQGSIKIYPTTSLDSLKNNLTVTAHYSDGSSNTITDYVLSGNLTVGTSTITITYNGKTTTFDVSVTENSTTNNIAANPIFYVDGRYGTSTAAEGVTWNNMGTKSDMVLTIAQCPLDSTKKGFFNGALNDSDGGTNFKWSNLPSLDNYTFELNCKLKTKGTASGSLLDTGSISTVAIYQKKEDDLYGIWASSKSYNLSKILDSKDCIQIRREGSKVEIFRNGILATTITDANTTPTTGTVVNISSFVGAVYSCIIYDRLLTDEELEQNRNYENSLNRGVN